MTLLLFFCLVLAVRAETEEKLDPVPPGYYIINGEEAERHEFPSMASIQLGQMHVCGATLISKRYVLTAGHCFRNQYIEEFNITLSDEIYLLMTSIRFGAHNNSWTDDPDVQVLKVKKIIRHPNYTPIFEHDFTLLELEKDVILTKYIQPICLGPVDKDLAGHKATVAGWGHTKHGDFNSASDVLRKADVSVVGQKECAEKLKQSTQKLLDDMICAGGNEKDGCQGDSGGPLYWIDNKGAQRVIGVVSWGLGYGNPGLPGVYSRVSSAIDWIKSVAGDDVC